MRQRKYIAALNMERLRTIHHLIDLLVPIDPLPPELVADLKKAAIACGGAIAGANTLPAQFAKMMVGEMAHDKSSGFYDVPAGEAQAGRRKVKKLVYPSSGRRGFINK